MDHAALVQLLAYHHWAFDRLLGALRALPTEALARPTGGSFATGRALLAHILGAEWVWLERWLGRSPPAFPDLGACETVEQFVARWEPVKAAQRQFLRGCDSTQLEAPVSYTNFRGQPWRYPLSAVVVHLVNHGTYHRGQLAHLLRQLGAAPPATDYLVFLDEGGAAEAR